MMFEAFFEAYPLETRIRHNAWTPADLTATGFTDLMGRGAGERFHRGLYRLHDRDSAAAADVLVHDAFPGFAARARCFAFDWLGRQFALDAARTAGPTHEPLILLFEPGTGDALEVPATFEQFHEDTLLEEADAALAVDFFQEWSRKNPEKLPLERDQCVGYKKPLFLGGSDTIDNLEVSDIDVYWTLCGQLFNQLRDS